jgi:hypothetical protein
VIGSFFLVLFAVDMQKDEFRGVHYRVSVAFAQRPINGKSPNSDVVAALARKSEEPEIVTEVQWHNQFVRDWCQGNEAHRLVARKPALMRWRAWYLKCLVLDVGEGWMRFFLFLFLWFLIVLVFFKRRRSEQALASVDSRNGMGAVECPAAPCF